MVLSRRCVNFLSSCYLSEQDHGTRGAYGALEADIRSAEQGYAGGALRGAVIPIRGGGLFGWCHIGARRFVKLSTPGGVSVVKVAEHNDAQCAIVMALDGRVGVSWTDDFLARYSHLTHFLEAAAVWSGLADWWYAETVQGHPEQVLREIPNCHLLPEASGEFVRWWATADYAVYAEPRLADPAASPVAHVSVMARTMDLAQTLASQLRNEVDGKRPEVLLRAPRKVGEDLPDVPTSWGKLVPIAALPDYLKSLNLLAGHETLIRRQRSGPGDH